jgi:sulfotransferase
MEKIFYQSSLPRSGSTVLQNILGQNPDFYVTPTSGVLELIFGARMNYTNSAEFKAQDSELMKKGYLNFCKQGMDGFYNAITDKKFVVDKSRGWGIHHDLLKSIRGENPKIICMVRNLKQILASMERMYRESPEASSDIIDWSTGKGTNTASRIDTWMGLDGGNGVPVGMALKRLEQMILEGIDKNVHFVRFEDLTLEPQKTLDKIYEYLEVPTYTHDFKNIEQITIEDDEVYGINKNLHKIHKEMKPYKNYYHEVLGNDICNWIDERYTNFQKRFKYT